MVWDVVETNDFINLRNNPFQVTIKLNQSSSLYIHLRDTSTDQVFSGHYSPDYVEQMTRKTGNYKRFNVFADMLLSAVRQESDAVNLDLLTSDDLENLKGKTGTKQKDRHLKRYLILTYAVAYDRLDNAVIELNSRVHYPLPLQTDDDIAQEEEHAFIHQDSNAHDYEKAFYEMKDAYDLAMDKLSNKREQYEQLLQEKEDAERELEMFKTQMKHEIDILTRQVQQSSVEKVLHQLAQEKEEKRRLLRAKDLTIKELEQALSNRRNIYPRTSRSVTPVRGTTIAEPRKTKPSPVTRAPSKERSRGVARFDPTAYVKEREARLEQLRSRSRDRRSPSVDSQGSRFSNRSDRSSKPKEDVFERLYSQRKTPNTFRSYSKERTQPISRSSSKESLTRNKKPSNINRPSPSKKEAIKEFRNLSIEERLASLKRFLASQT